MNPHVKTILVVAVAVVAAAYLAKNYPSVGQYLPS
jgi:hypothetical protein